MRSIDTAVHNRTGAGLSFPGGIDTYLLHRPEPGMGHEDKSVEHAACNRHRSYCGGHLTPHLIYSLKKDL